MNLHRPAIRSRKACWALLVIVFIAFESAANVITSPVTEITSIYTKADGARPFIRVGANAMPGCNSDNGAYLSLADPAGANRIYSTVLAAYLSKKSVSVYYVFADMPAGYAGWGLCEIQAIAVQ